MAKKPESDSVFDMFAKLGRDLKLPSMEIERVLEYHRKNLEALQKSASASASGASSVMAKQREILQETLREITDMAQSYRVPGNPQEIMTKQADFARKTFETAVKNAGEVADIMKRSGAESIDILRKRIQESMEEIRDSYHTGGDKD
ncbi:phasin family protein [Mesorhizobium sp. 1B3]|uniref:phasin family protein n=1 Tax=Mesorhizobium sp. 1B3 TaxID=3243599 RepID=UPI003D956C8C